MAWRRRGVWDRGIGRPARRACELRFAIVRAAAYSLYPVCVCGLEVVWLEGARVTTHSSLQKPNFARQNSIAKPFLPKTYDDCSSRRLLSPRRRTAAASVLWRGAGAGVWRPSSRRFSTVHVPHTTTQQLAWLQQATLLGGSRFWQTFCKSGTFVRNCILTYLWCSLDEIIDYFMMGFLRTPLFESQNIFLELIFGQKFG